jgi:hypothetical protein
MSAAYWYANQESTVSMLHVLILRLELSMKVVANIFLERRNHWEYIYVCVRAHARVHVCVCVCVCVCTWSNSCVHSYTCSELHCNLVKYRLSTWVFLKSKLDWSTEIANFLYHTCLIYIPCYIYVGELLWQFFTVFSHFSWY